MTSIWQWNGRMLQKCTVWNKKLSLDKSSTKVKSRTIIIVLFFFFFLVFLILVIIIVEISCYFDWIRTLETNSINETQEKFSLDYRKWSLLFYRNQYHFIFRVDHWIRCNTLQITFAFAVTELHTIRIWTWLVPSSLIVRVTVSSWDEVFFRIR